MTDVYPVLVSFLGGLALGGCLFFIYLKLMAKKRRAKLRKDMGRLLSDAKNQASRIEKSAQIRARDFERKMRHRAEISVRKEKKRMEDMKYQMESRKNQLESEFKRKEEDMELRIKEIEQQKEQARMMQSQMEKMTQKAQDRLKELNQMRENVSGLSRAEAAQEMRTQMEKELKEEMASQIKEMETKFKGEALARSRVILSQAIARFASEVSTEHTTTSVPIKMEKTKGKIIGREGRNIRSLEAACGVDIIIDESQEIIIISCFDPIRREVAQRAINKLLEEGRVHPARIEEIVSKMKRDLFGSMTEAGKKACFDLGVREVRPALMETLGSLKYRSLQGQNALKISQEVAWLAGLIASEVGFDVKTARRAGLFHTIGLAVDHRVEGSYASVGAQYLRKQGESLDICQAVHCHGGEKEPESVLDHLVASAYNLFHERPGARHSDMENYVERLKDMESIANSFDGVVRSFAIRAGKEIRVLVDSGKVTDDQALMLSRDIATKIQKEMDETGGMLVRVVREFRMVEQAR